MTDSSVEIHINMVFFLAGAMIGILGGLLSGFCVTAFYRWFDYYNAEVTINPHSFPISIDFWVFIFGLIGIIGLTYYFYCFMLKSIKKIKDSAGLPQESKETTSDEVKFPIVIEKCPICGKIFKGQSDYCEVCGKQLLPIHPDDGEEKTEAQSFGIVIDFFKDNSNLFTILAAITALISMIPLFSTFLLGENWLKSILSNQMGPFTLLLILISLFGLGFFVYYLVWMILLDFSYKIILNKKMRLGVKLQSTIFMAVGLIAIGSVFGFLVLSWFSQIDFIKSIFGLYLLIFVVIVPFCLITLSIFWDLFKQSKRCSDKVLNIIVILILLAVTIITLIILIQGAVVVSNEISKYYTSKTLPVKIEYSVVNQTNNLPSLISLKGKGDSYFSDKPISDFDLIYLQCHWSTNYGYFITVTSNNSVIKKESQELVIAGCGNPSDTIFWTYDIDDYGKNKPQVFIGLNLEDQNKKNNNQLGHASLIINWTGPDSFIFENRSVFIGE